MPIVDPGARQGVRFCYTRSPSVDPPAKNDIEGGGRPVTLVTGRAEESMSTGEDQRHPARGRRGKPNLDNGSGGED